MASVLFIIFCIVKNIRLIKVGQLCKTPKMSTSFLFKQENICMIFSVVETIGPETMR